MSEQNKTGLVLENIRAKIKEIQNNSNIETDPDHEYMAEDENQSNDSKQDTSSSQMGEDHNSTKESLTNKSSYDINSDDGGNGSLFDPDKEEDDIFSQIDELDYKKINEDLSGLEVTTTQPAEDFVEFDSEHKDLSSDLVSEDKNEGGEDISSPATDTDFNSQKGSDEKRDSFVPDFDLDRVSEIDDSQPLEDSEFKESGDEGDSTVKAESDNSLSFLNQDGDSGIDEKEESKFFGTSVDIEKETFDEIDDKNQDVANAEGDIDEIDDENQDVAKAEGDIDEIDDKNQDVAKAEGDIIGDIDLDIPLDEDVLSDLIFSEESASSEELVDNKNPDLGVSLVGDDISDLDGVELGVDSNISDLDDNILDGESGDRQDLPLDNEVSDIIDDLDSPFLEEGESDRDVSDIIDDLDSSFLEEDTPDDINLDNPSDKEGRDALISVEVANQVSSSIKDLKNSIISNNSNLFKSKVSDEVVRSELRIWLNDNLPDIVDKVVREEIVKLVDKS